MAPNLFARGFTHYAINKALAHLSPGIDPVEVSASRNLPSREGDAITKAAMAASGLADLATGTYSMGASEFWKETEHVSVVQKLKPAFQPVLPNVPIQVQTALLEGTEVGEGELIPLSQVNLSAMGVTLRKAIALVIGSNEFFRTRGCAPALERMMQKAGAAGSDKVFVEGLIDEFGGSNAVTATSDPRVSLASMLEIVNTTGNGSLFFVLHPTEINNILATGTDSTGTDPFFDLSPTGGTVFNVPALVSPYLTRDSAGGTAILIDASRILFSDYATTIHASEGAAIQSMSDDPATDGDSWISLFQADATALKIVRHFGWKAMDDSAVCVLDSIDWAAE